MLPSWADKIPPPTNTKALKKPASSLKKSNSLVLDTAPENPSDAEVRNAEMMKILEGATLLKSRGHKTAPRKYPAAFAVFMIPAVRYDQSKSARISGRKSA